MVKKVSVLILGFAVVLSMLSGCAFLKPLPKGQSLKTRLHAFPTEGIPLKGKAEIYWNDYQIPFIHASLDEDVPLLLGMVHAHLRLAQIELLRRASQGRLAEMFGPFAADIDHSLRILNLGKSIMETAASLPPETRQWLDRFAQGINVYLNQTSSLPPELSMLDLKQEPWTLKDLLGMARLVSIDINWLYWFFMLKGKTEKAWPEIWERMKRHGKASLPSFAPSDDGSLLLMNSAVKSGSNSLVVSGNKTESGSAFIASDPHVGLMLPSLWLVVGFKSPSYHVLGFSIPGFPVVVLGRNLHIAWGGTNMLSLSSSLYDISSQEFDDLKEREETIRVRWWFNRKIKIRESILGPVISDSPFLKKLNLPRLALKWRGHQASDETTAFIGVNRATSWKEFRRAFETYAVSGQNFLYADAKGNIGQLLAVEFPPAAGKTVEDLIGDPRNPNHLWKNSIKSTDLPAVQNPEQGYLVSTNNMPVRTDPPLSFFGNTNDRFQTISNHLERSNPISLDDLKQIQPNVYSGDSFALSKAILSKLPADRNKLLSSLATWDGTYGIDSKGAAAFELLVYHLASGYYTERYGKKLARYLLRSPAVYAFLRQDLEDHKFEKHMQRAIQKASEDFDTYDAWGKLHLLRLSHPFGNIPVLGRKFRFGDHPVPGSTNTVMKSAHPLSNEKHFATYGSNARHISDLSDPDENYFVLLGGQDGYLGSENYMDQFPLWQKNHYIRIPLRLETVRKTFTHRMVLSGPRSTP